MNYTSELIKQAREIIEDKQADIIEELEDLHDYPERYAGIENFIVQARAGHVTGHAWSSSPEDEDGERLSLDYQGPVGCLYGTLADYDDYKAGKWEAETSRHGSSAISGILYEGRSFGEIKGEPHTLLPDNPLLVLLLNIIEKHWEAHHGL
jgi:hypothetical protein